MTIPGANVAPGDSLARTQDALRLAIQNGASQAAVDALGSGVTPDNYLSGLTLSNNGSDTTNDINIAAGVAMDSTNAVLIEASALTKQLDANWAAGTNQGMRNSAVAIANGTYHLYAVAKAAGADPDIYAHTSATVSTVLTALQAETGGADYIYARRVGSILRESASIVQFNQKGDTFKRVTSVLDVNATSAGASAVTRTMSVPTGIVLEMVMAVAIVSGSAGFEYVWVSSLDETDQATSDSGAAFAITTGVLVPTLGISGTTVGGIFTNTSAQIRTRQNQGAADTKLTIRTLGWIDRRGRD